MHTVIMIAEQQDNRRKSRIETKLEMAVLESDETISCWTVINTITHVIINYKELVIFIRMWNHVLARIAHGQWQKCINNAQSSSGTYMPPALKLKNGENDVLHGVYFY